MRIFPCSVPFMKIFLPPLTWNTASYQSEFWIGEQNGHKSISSVITFFSWKLLHVCMCVTLWINVHIIATDTFTMATCNYKYCKAIPNAMLRHCSCSKSKFAYNFKKFISNLTLLHRALHPPCASVYFRRNFLYYYFQFLLLWQS